jgi:hypothetical protein
MQKKILCEHISVLGKGKNVGILKCKPAEWIYHRLNYYEEDWFVGVLYLHMLSIFNIESFNETQ